MISSCSTRQDTFIMLQLVKSPLLYSRDGEADWVWKPHSSIGDISSQYVGETHGAVWWWRNDSRSRAVPPPPSGWTLMSTLRQTLSEPMWAQSPAQWTSWLWTYWFRLMMLRIILRAPYGNSVHAWQWEWGNLTTRKQLWTDTPWNLTPRLTQSPCMQLQSLRFLSRGEGAV